jgi:hypothetical protein
VFEYLDVKYIAALEEFIIVKPYFYHKAMDWMTFGVIQCFIKDRTKFVYSYTELCKKIDISFTDLANNVPPHLFKKELPDLTSSVDPGDYRLNIEGQEISEVEKKQALEFQNSIRGMIIKTGYEINNLRDYVTVWGFRKSVRKGFPQCSKCWCSTLRPTRTDSRPRGSSGNR